MAIDEQTLHHAETFDQSGGCDLLIGITGLSDADQVRGGAANLLASVASNLPAGEALRITVAYPGFDDAREVRDAEGAAQLRLVSYAMPATESGSTPWAVAAAAQRTLLGLAAESQARACVLLHPDLHVLTGGAFAQLATPVLERKAELVLPIYRQGRYDGLLNSAILAPLTRALYGKRVQFPLASDFAVSARLVARLLQSAHTPAHVSAGSILWPIIAAATIDAPVAEVVTTVRHGVQTEGLDLSAVIAQLVGSAFAEMEHNAPLWQRVRASHAVPPATGDRPAAAQLSTEHTPEGRPEVRSLVDSFLLGSRSLQEVWGLVLPPVTLLELKRLTRVAPDSFRMPDDLWARIVYDFALAFRLRVIGRTHLLGALTPLYLGWVASYVNDLAGAGQAPEARHEQLARAFEDGKPYLVRRWRWPDRFNP